MKNYLIIRFIFTFIFITMVTGSFSKSKNFREKLVIGVSQEFDALNPIISSMMVTRYIQGASIRSLAIIDKDWKWICLLCTKIPSFEDQSARFVEESGKKVLYADWEITKEATWSDGLPITANDFQLGWEIGTSKNVSSSQRNLWSSISEIQIDKKNPKKFTLKYKEARYDFTSLSLAPIPSQIERAIWEKTKNIQGAYEKQSAYVSAPTTSGLYSGPYKISEVKLGSHLVLERNSNFKGKKPEIKRIIVKVIPNTQTLEANLLSGTIDMIPDIGFSFDQAIAFEKRLKKNKDLSRKYNIYFREGMVYEHLDVNLNNEILKDILVRKAMVHAIDREKLVNALFEGKQKMAKSAVHPLDFNYSENIVQYPYDIKKAAKLLDQAGWKLGKDKYRYKNGKKFSVRLMTTSQNKTRELVEVWLQNEWKKVGIHITIKNEPARVFFGETISKRKSPGLSMYAWTSRPDYDQNTNLHSKQIPSEANGWEGQNYPSYSNAKVDSYIEQFQKEFDRNKRKSLMEKIMYHYTDDVPVIPLYLRSQNSIAPKTLENMALTGHQYPPTNTIEFWTFSKKVSH